MTGGDEESSKKMAKQQERVMKVDQRSNHTYQKQIPANNSTTKIFFILGNFKHHTCIQQTCFCVYF
jgi:hypothetical protein